MENRNMKKWEIYTGDLYDLPYYINNPIAGFKLKLDELWTSLILTELKSSVDGNYIICEMKPWLDKKWNNVSYEVVDIYGCDKEDIKKLIEEWMLTFIDDSKLKKFFDDDEKKYIYTRRNKFS
jgi:hypothetical protein